MLCAQLQGLEQSAAVATRRFSCLLVRNWPSHVNSYVHVGLDLLTQSLSTTHGGNLLAVVHAMLSKVASSEPAWTSLKQGLTSFISVSGHRGSTHIARLGIYFHSQVQDAHRSHAPCRGVEVRYLPPYKSHRHSKTHKC